MINREKDHVWVHHNFWLWKYGFGFYYSYGKREWHTGRHTFVLSLLKREGYEESFINWKYLFDGKRKEF